MLRLPSTHSTTPSFSISTSTSTSVMDHKTLNAWLDCFPDAATADLLACDANSPGQLLDFESSLAAEFGLRNADSLADSLSPPEAAAEGEHRLEERRESDSSTEQGGKAQASSRRRAQNRAAQRAFRERKEKRAKELEEQLVALSKKYKALEGEHGQLQQAYDKLQQTLELLVCDDEGRSSTEQLRRFLDIIQGKTRARIKR